MKQKTKLNKILVLILSLFVVGLVCLTAYSYAYFSDQKSGVITITMPSSGGSTFVSSKTVSSSNLIAGNTFTETVTLTNKANFDYNVRFYAVVESQVHLNYSSTVSTVKNIVSLTSVTSSTKDSSDNKFYYGSKSSPTKVTSTTTSLKLTFTFKVAETFTNGNSTVYVNEDLYTYNSGSSFVKDSSLTTTITYYAEVIQAGGTWS